MFRSLRIVRDSRDAAPSSSDGRKLLDENLIPEMDVTPGKVLNARSLTGGAAKRHTDGDRMALLPERFFLMAFGIFALILGNIRVKRLALLYPKVHGNDKPSCGRMVCGQAWPPDVPGAFGARLHCPQRLVSGRFPEMRCRK